MSEVLYFYGIPMVMEEWKLPDPIAEKAKECPRCHRTWYMECYCSDLCSDCYTEVIRKLARAEVVRGTAQ